MNRLLNRFSYIEIDTYKGVARLIIAAYMVYLSYIFGIDVRQRYDFKGELGDLKYDYSNPNQFSDTDFQYSMFESFGYKLAGLKSLLNSMLYLNIDDQLRADITHSLGLLQSIKDDSVEILDSNLFVSLKANDIEKVKETMESIRLFVELNKHIDNVSMEGVIDLVGENFARVTMLALVNQVIIAIGFYFNSRQEL